MSGATPLEPPSPGRGTEMAAAEPFGAFADLEPLVPDSQAYGPFLPEPLASDPVAPHPLAPDPLAPRPPAGSDIAPPPVPAVQSTRRLLGTSFDLLTRSTGEMRRASFYIGAIVLGTIGPFALAILAFDVASPTGLEGFNRLARTSAGGWFSLLAIVAFAGLIVASVESRNMAVAILGGQYAERPVDVAAALARSRMAFWRAIGASIIVGVPVSIATNIVDGVVSGLLNGSTAASLIVAFLVGVLVGAPLAYVLTGVVLGDVGAVESVRRSFRVYRARKLAAAFVAGFDLLAVLIVFFGISVGLELMFDVANALGLGTHSGPIALAAIAGGVIAVVFAFGTLIFTALAISLSPQVVMFVGLTRATMGLDHVRPGGDHDPLIRRPGRRRFRWLTIPMLIGFLIGLSGLIGVVETLPS